MKLQSSLTRINSVQEQLHESDKKEYPEHHSLTKDSYIKYELGNMCLRCDDHYEWEKQMQYDARTDTYYKTRK